MTDALPICAEDAELAEPPAALTVPEDDAGMSVLWKTCQTLARPGNVVLPAHLRNKPEAVLMTVLLGREIGLKDMQALTRIYYFEGKPTLSAELILGLVRRAGHSITYPVRSAEACTALGKRRDSGDTLEVTWTIEDAERAGLAKKDNWKTYPRAMLHARATTELARALFSDAVGWAVYAPEDFDQHEED